MWRDLERVCAQQGLALRRPSTFPRNGLLAARLACCFASEAWCPEFVRRVYHANFAEDRDISEPRSLESTLESLGQPAALLAKALSPEIKARLRSQTEHAASLGIFGAPTFIVDGELFWGNDRLEVALSCAKSPAQERA
jgi:2-hydroxychromene-2-carboxylate isomerase